jgi:hypothetical protein
MEGSSFCTIPAGEGMISAFFDSAVLSVFPFEQEQPAPPIHPGTH